MLFRHDKTGKIYRLLTHGIDCTNSRDGTGVVLYCTDENENTIFVRETREFHEKFTCEIFCDLGAGDSTVECSYEVDDSGNAMIVGIDCCEHGVTSPTGCDECYDKK